MEIMLKSKIVSETLKTKGYDLNQVETGAQIKNGMNTQRKATMIKIVYA